MATLANTVEKSTVLIQELNSLCFDNFQQSNFLQEVIEGLLDGILIFTMEGEVVHANASAYRICCQLNQSKLNSNFVQVPPQVWQICESLIESRSLFPNQSLILFDEIVVDKATTFRLRVRWLDLAQFTQPCLLVTIEDRYESIRNVALAEAKKYSMTRREAEIWSLYRADYSYKQIATELYITLNTVKKHMKNIHAKRQVLLVEEEE